MLLQQGLLWPSCHQLLHRLVYWVILMIAHVLRRCLMLQQASLCLWLSLPVLFPSEGSKPREEFMHA